MKVIKISRILFVPTAKEIAAEYFAADRPFLVVLFFHGFESLCARGYRRPFEEALRRHELSRQLAASNCNAVIVVPRMALSAR